MAISRGILTDLFCNAAMILARRSWADRFPRSRVIGACGPGMIGSLRPCFPIELVLRYPLQPLLLASLLLREASAPPRSSRDEAPRPRWWLGPLHLRSLGLPRLRSIPLPRRSDRPWRRSRTSPHLRDRWHPTSLRRDRASSVQLRCHGLLPSPRARFRASPNRGAQAHRPP